MLKIIRVSNGNGHVSGCVAKSIQTASLIFCGAIMANY